MADAPFVATDFVVPAEHRAAILSSALCARRTSKSTLRRCSRRRGACAPSLPRTTPGHETASRSMKTSTTCAATRPSGSGGSRSRTRCCRPTSRAALGCVYLNQRPSSATTASAPAVDDRRHARRRARGCRARVAGHRVALSRRRLPGSGANAVVGLELPWRDEAVPRIGTDAATVVMYNARACGLALTEEPRPPAPAAARCVGPPLGGAAAAALVHRRRRWDLGGALASRLAAVLWLAERGAIRGCARCPTSRRASGEFRNTVAFWIACCYAEASSSSSARSPRWPRSTAWREAAMVEYSYFAGSLLYTAGAYLGHYEVINVARPRHAAASSPSPARRPRATGARSPTWSAPCYSTSTAAPPRCRRARQGGRRRRRVEPVHGRFGALRRRRDDRMGPQPRRAPEGRRVVAVLLLLGRLALLPVASIAGLTLSGGGGGGGGGTWACDFPFAVGSAAFFCGAWVALRMWKREQFGLGFIREINSLPPQTPAAPASPAWPPPPPLPAAVGLAARAVGLPAVGRALVARRLRARRRRRQRHGARRPRRRRRRDRHVGVFVRHRACDPAPRDRRVAHAAEGAVLYLLALMKLLALLFSGARCLRWVAAFV